MSAQPRADTAPALRLDGVAKSFPRRRSLGELLRRPWASRGRVEAVRGVSFAVGRNEIIGLLGPNGAGKTTLLKIVCGLIVPDAGRVEVFGETVEGPRLSRLVGLVHGDERSFYWRLTARENLDFFARLHGFDRAERARRIGRLLDKVGLADDADRRFGDFSSGMRQRLAIARGLLADPPILLMDEPTRSLDPVTAAALREFVTEELHAGDGKAILVATHNLREAETLCDRVVVLSRGMVRADDTPEALRKRGLGGIAYRLRLVGGRVAA
ncbi:MAG: ABC transporter ATP-binding protein, partial [Acidobacteria bacterium]